jgi:hypothetical protein
LVLPIVAIRSSKPSLLELMIDYTKLIMLIFDGYLAHMEQLEAERNEVAKGEGCLQIS